MVNCSIVFHTGFISYSSLPSKLPIIIILDERKVLSNTISENVMAITFITLWFDQLMILL